jgi:hypothetical protein
MYKHNNASTRSSEIMNENVDYICKYMWTYDLTCNKILNLRSSENRMTEHVQTWRCNYTAIRTSYDRKHILHMRIYTGIRKSNDLHCNKYLNILSSENHDRTCTNITKQLHGQSYDRTHIIIFQANHRQQIFKYNGHPKIEWPNMYKHNNATTRSCENRMTENIYYICNYIRAYVSQMTYTVINIYIYQLYGHPKIEWPNMYKHNTATTRSYENHMTEHI